MDYIEKQRFEEVMRFILKNEGFLNTNPKDRGSITKYGISLRFLKSIPLENLKNYDITHRDEDQIRSLTLAQAYAIYHGEFWSQAPFNKIKNLEHCKYIFDMAINLGIAPAIKCVQRACWAVMRKWEELKDDGILGDKTLIAIDLCGHLIMPALRAERGNYYRNIVKAHPEQQEFLDGWYNRTYHD